MRAPRVARIWTALLALIAAVTVVVLGLMEGVTDAVADTRWWGIAGALCLAAISVMAEGAVIAVLYGDVRVKSVLRMTRAYLAGDFVGMATPWSLGGTPTWLWALSREGVQVGVGAVLVAGRAIAASTFFAVMGVVTAVVVPTAAVTHRAWLWVVIVPLCVLALLGYAARRPEQVSDGARSALVWLGQKTGWAQLAKLADHVPEEVRGFAVAAKELGRKRPLALLGALLATALSRFSQMLAIPLLLAAQGSHVDVSQAAAGLLLVWFVSSLAPAPSGEGIAQGMIVSVFGPLNGSAQAAAAALVWRATVFYPVFLVGGALFARMVRGAGVPGRETAP